MGKEQPSTTERKYWIKLQRNTPGDEKMRSLSPVHRYVFIAYCCIAEHVGRWAGYLVDATGRPYTQRELAEEAGVSQAEVCRANKLFLSPEYDMLTLTKGGRLKIKNYNKYQDKSSLSDSHRIKTTDSDSQRIKSEDFDSDRIKEGQSLILTESQRFSQNHGDSHRIKEGEMSDSQRINSAQNGDGSETCIYIEEVHGTREHERREKNTHAEVRTNNSALPQSSDDMCVDHPLLSDPLLIRYRALFRNGGSIPTYEKQSTLREFIALKSIDEYDTEKAILVIESWHAHCYNDWRRENQGQLCPCFAWLAKAIRSHLQKDTLPGQSKVYEPVTHAQPPMADDVIAQLLEGYGNG